MENCLFGEIFIENEVLAETIFFGHLECDKLIRILASTFEEMLNSY